MLKHEFEEIVKRKVINEQFKTIEKLFMSSIRFCRFNYRTSEKVYKEFMLYAIGRNINKYHRFLHDEIKKFEGKTEEKAA